jgi:hypothetical protein
MPVHLDSEKDRILAEDLHSLFAENLVFTA